MELDVFDAHGVTGCSQATATCAPLWRGVNAGGGVIEVPAVADGKVFTGPVVFDAAGKTNCGGTPRTCLPLWIYNAQCLSCERGETDWETDPVVVDGTVFEVGAGEGSEGEQSDLYAFDENGHANCHSTPLTCDAMWTAHVPELLGMVAVANGTLYASGIRDFLNAIPGHLWAFDEHGVVGCSKSANGTSCDPLWSAADGGGAASPTVANGVVYIANDALHAYDADGNQGCTGTPKTCVPLRSDALAGRVAYFGEAVVANGIVYTHDTTGLHAFTTP